MGVVTRELPDTVQIATEATQIEIDTRRGGRIAQITFRGVELLVDEGSGRPRGDPMRWGSYPMVPWAGRVRAGQFEFDGHRYQLPVKADGHAIHGVGYTSPWTVDSRTTTSLEMSLDLPTDHTWPFGGRSRQRITVGDEAIVLELDVTAAERRCPVVIGWHPWFRKPERFDFRPSAMYRREGGIAIDEQIDVPAGPWDDCFVNFEPVVATIGGVTVRLTSDCTEWVVYDQPEHASCIEPQSGPPDSFNIDPKVLGPCETLSRWLRIELAR